MILVTESPLVGVMVAPDERRLVAVRDIPLGTRLYDLDGRETPVPTRYSVQISRTMHLDQGDGLSDEAIVAQYYWRFMNHDCVPSTVIRNRAVFALRDIAVGDAVTFDYNTTEYDMAEPFICRCGRPECVGLVKGVRHLTAAQRARIEPWLPDYLR